MSKNQLPENIYSELKNLADTLEELLSDSKDKTKEEIEHLRHKAFKTLNNARECLGQTGKFFSKKTHKALCKVNEYIHKNPWNGMSIGTVFGLILGIFISKR